MELSEQNTRRPEETSMAGKSIVWVEDDPDIIDGIEPLLKREGWNVHTASSARDGKALAARQKPDLIIMDIIMEGEHGFSAVEDLKNDPQLGSVPVIIFSSVTHRWGETRATREQGMLTEAEEFVDKAGGPVPLIRAVRKVLGE
jgi:CheY-like chemotaxis protein